MKYKQKVTVPSIESLVGIISQYKDYRIDINLDPEIEFGVISKNGQSGFSCMMTQDHALFSIDILNAKDELLIEILAEILNKYELETDKLFEDITNCYINRISEMQTDYERHWVIYSFDKEDGIVQTRYRAFVSN